MEACNPGFRMAICARELMVVTSRHMWRLYVGFAPNVVSFLAEVAAEEAEVGVEASVNVQSDYEAGCRSESHSCQ